METNIVVQNKTENIAEFSIIQNIYEIRGYRVMLDFDLAVKYEIENKYLKRAVRSNMERFEGEDFMFELSKEEWKNLRCRNCTSNAKNSRGGIRYMPFAFTELGVAMLSSVLNSEKAIKVNRDIMRAFVTIRTHASNYAGLKQELDHFKTETKEQIGVIYDVLDELVNDKKEREKPRNKIGFKQNNDSK